MAFNNSAAAGTPAGPAGPSADMLAALLSGGAGGAGAGQMDMGGLMSMMSTMSSMSNLTGGAGAGAGGVSADAKVDALPRALTAAEKEEALKGFMEILEDFLKALQVKFPNCQALKDQYEEFVHIAKPTQSLHPTLISKWHHNMKRHYMNLQSNHVQPLLDDDKNRMFAKLKIREKWADPNFTAEDRKQLLVYLQELNQLTMMYYDCRVTLYFMQMVPTSDEQAQHMATAATAGPSGIAQFLSGNRLAGIMMHLMQESQTNPGVLTEMQDLMAAMPTEVMGSLPPQLQAMMQMAMTAQF